MKLKNQTILWITQQDRKCSSALQGKVPGKYFNLNIVSSYYMQYWWLNYNYFKKNS